MQASCKLAILSATGAASFTQKATEVFRASQAVGFPRFAYINSFDFINNALVDDCLHLSATVTVMPS